MTEELGLLYLPMSMSLSAFNKIQKGKDRHLLFQNLKPTEANIV
jgi:hypothetical protein